MHRHNSFRTRVEVVIAAIAGMLCLLTIVWPDWIEGTFGFDPDHHSGWAEWLIVVILALISVSCGLLARRDFETSPATQGSSR